MKSDVSNSFPTYLSSFPFPTPQGELFLLLTYTDSSKASSWLTPFLLRCPHETELPGCLLSVRLVAPSPLLGSERSSQHKLNFPRAVKAPSPLVPYPHFLPISLLSLACHHEASFPGHPLPPFTFFPLLEYQISCPQHNQPSRRSPSITTHILLYPLLGSHAFLYLIMVHFVYALWCGYSCSRVSQPAF